MDIRSREIVMDIEGYESRAWMWMVGGVEGGTCLEVM